MLAEVYCIGNNEVRVELQGIQEKDTYQIFWNDEPEKTLEKERLIATGTGFACTFYCEDAYEHPIYFTIAFPNHTTVVAGIRILPITGMYNVRDLGGYPTKDGRYVKWGMLYRGDHLYNIKEEGLPYLYQLGLHTIIDFRGEMEAQKYPNTTGDSDIPQYRFAPDGQIAAFAGSLQNEEHVMNHENQIMAAREQIKKDKNYASKSMIQQQIEFVHTQGSKEAYRNTLLKMADPQAIPLYFHCKGGKDRTGFAAMLLLSILGVDEDFILYDYLLTNRAREKKNKRYLENFRKMANGDEEVAQYLFSMFDTRKEYLQAALQEIHTLYGDVRTYVKTELGIDEETLQTLQSLYLEDAL